MKPKLMTKKKNSSGCFHRWFLRYLCRDPDLHADLVNAEGNLILALVTSTKGKDEVWFLAGVKTIQRVSHSVQGDGEWSASLIAYL